MPKVKVAFQETAIGLVKFMQDVCARCVDDDQEQDPYLKLLMKDIEALAPQYVRTLKDYHQTSQKKRDYLGERRELVSQLKYHVRDFWAGLKRRIRRMKYPDRILGEFQYPQQSGSPMEINDPRELVILAETIVAGDASLVSKGYPPMSNPTAAEINELLELYLVVESDNGASLTHFKVQHKLKGFINEGIRLQRLLNHVLQTNNNQLEPSALRNLMRNYGFVFPGEAGASDSEPETDTSDETDVSPDESLNEEPSSNNDNTNLQLEQNNATALAEPAPEVDELAQSSIDEAADKVLADLDAVLLEGKQRTQAQA